MAKIKTISLSLRFGLHTNRNHSQTFVSSPEYAGRIVITVGIPTGHFTLIYKWDPPQMYFSTFCICTL